MSEKGIHHDLAGFFAVNKPAAWTSHDVIAWLRSRLKIKTIGHAGTLDPMATGVLIVGIGRDYTKRLDEWKGQEKIYLAEITLGANSDTDDAMGKITPVSTSIPDPETLTMALKNFIGKINQLPPDYSAKKIQGQRLYVSARAGISVEKKPSTVEIKSIDSLNYSYPKLAIRIVCGPGTYIRSIARDMGEKLGSGAYLSGLIREKIGSIDISQTFLPDDSKKDLVDWIKEFEKYRIK